MNTVRWLSTKFSSYRRKAYITPRKCISTSC